MNIYSEMSQLAVELGAVNLGQGFPDESGPESMLKEACEAVLAGLNQYPPTRGLPVLRQAIAAHQSCWYGIDLDCDEQVVVTAGASEGITACLLSVLDAGDEVLVFEPFYDHYPAAIRLAGGIPRFVPWDSTTGAADLAAAAAAVTPRTKAMIVNTPGNPSGRVWVGDILAGLAALASRHNLTVISDEVYEHIVFDGRTHVCVASCPGMPERTLTVSSASKSFSVTGWKIGWVTGPRHLVDTVHEVKQYLSFASGTPFQIAVASALAFAPNYFDTLASSYQARRDLLVCALSECGFEVSTPEGGYFVLADCGPLGFRSAREFCQESPARLGVVGIPADIYFDQPARSTLVRFTFAKSMATVAEGIARIRGGHPRG
jgi:N-succinyldiaminopimelate aminotransferase